MNLVADSGQSVADTVVEPLDCRVALVNWGAELGSSAEALDFVEALENWVFDSDSMTGPWDF